MKLYKLFEEIILEEINKHLHLTEGVAVDDINTIINGDDKGKHYHASFDYRDDDGNITNRWVQIYDYATTTANNDAISAYEVSSKGGDSMSKRPGWKIFRLDRMNNLKVSKVPFYRPISDVNPSIKGKFNPVGNNTPTLNGFNNKAKFDYQYKGQQTQPTQPEPQAQPQPVQRQQTQPTQPEPVQRQPEPVQTQPEPKQVRPMNRVQPAQQQQQQQVKPTPKLTDLDDENNNELNNLK